MTAAAIMALPSNDTCLLMALTVIRGPASGTTLVYCTCEWSRTFRTERGALSRAKAHMRLTTGKAP